MPTIARPALIATALFMAAATPPLSAQSGAGLAGEWRTDDNTAIIRFAPCGQTMCGSIARFIGNTPAGQLDENNPDRALRSRRVLGLSIFTGLTRNGNAWVGRGYDPKQGRNFNVTLTPAAARLTVRGCVAVFCQTKIFTRAS
jgi:uncharacterized protein (DUF2147 family)